MSEQTFQLMALKAERNSCNAANSILLFNKDEQGESPRGARKANLLSDKDVGSSQGTWYELNRFEIGSDPYAFVFTLTIPNDIKVEFVMLLEFPASIPYDTKVGGSYASGISLVNSQ